MLTELVTGISNIIYHVLHSVTSLSMAQLRLVPVGWGSWACTWDRKPGQMELRNSTPQPCRTQILNLRAWESFSSPAASPGSAEAAMNQQQISPSLMEMLVCTNHHLPA